MNAFANATPFVSSHPLLLLGVPAIAAAFIALEYVWRRSRGPNGYDLKESAATLGVALGRTLTRGVVLATTTPVFLFVYQHRLATIELNGVIAVIALFLVTEFFYYWYHRASHAVRWFWASHAVHHSSTRFNLSAAYRLGWTEAISGDWIFFLVPVWLGFHPVAVAAALALNLFYQFFLHTEAVQSLGPLDWVLNTPAHHRVHHALNESCRDKNFGGVLIVFDRLFGTFAAAPANEDLRYGVVGRAPSLNPLTIALREWAAMALDLVAARSVAGAWRVLFGAP